tara:strand:+ start:58 stop:669 length:612 start_codon:yes stop_codon:yes gene_type:complete
MRKLLLILIYFVIITACYKKNDNTDIVNLKEKIENYNLVKMLVEIPAGTLEKWEYNQLTKLIERDIKNGKPRTIHYLGYPANYGIILNTFSPIEQGGDGDPLDVFLLGPPLNKGAIQEVKIIGYIEMLDEQESDNKFIAVSNNDDLFGEINDISELQIKYPDLILIIKTWLKNYKGSHSDIIIENVLNAEMAKATLLKSLTYK